MPESTFSQQPGDPEAVVRAIIKALERAEMSGQRPYALFTTWLNLVETVLDALPHHADRLIQAGEMPDPAPLVEAIILGQAEERPPGRRDLEPFVGATQLLLDSPRQGYYDTLGRIYMTYVGADPKAGLMFTPWDVACAMARLAIFDGAEVVLYRLQDAAEAAAKASPAVEAMLLAGGLTATIGDEESAWPAGFFFQRLLPSLLPHFEPLRVCDPCVGSGTLLLAAAACFPLWAARLGLVRFWGMDINPDCVQMARLNCRLYGLNGSGLQDALSAPETTLAAYPYPYNDFYARFQAAHRRGDTAALEALTTQYEALRRQNAGRSVSTLEALTDETE
jgi:hypothetical protein